MRSDQPIRRIGDLHRHLVEQMVAQGLAVGQRVFQPELVTAAAGAIVGGIVGLTQEIKERKEQDRLAQERAYQQELSRKRAEEAKLKAAMDEELAAAQGFRISDMELTEAQGRVENASERLKRLQDERAAAIAKKKALDEANERLLTTEAEIARLEEELARLKSDTPLVGSTPTGGPVTSETLPLADAPRS